MADSSFEGAAIRAANGLCDFADRQECPFRGSCPHPQLNPYRLAIDDLSGYVSCCELMALTIADRRMITVDTADGTSLMEKIMH